LRKSLYAQSSGTNYEAKRPLNTEVGRFYGFDYYRELYATAENLKATLKGAIIGRPIPP
jgi:hypothetical protein